MLKTRLIACIITKNQLVVQSFGFNRYLPIGNVKTAIEFFVNWDVDEIMIIDIDATKQQRSPNIDTVKWAAEECFVPLTVGGGVQTIEHIQQLLKSGADKVCINNKAATSPNFVKQASDMFGSQCINVSIDVKETPSGYAVFDYTRQSTIDISPAEFAMQLERCGAGEILLNSVDRDGARIGYDTTLLKSVSNAVNIPVIALGGIGRFDQLSKGVHDGNCQALAAANIFQHMEHSTIAAKAQMKTDGLPVRLSSNVKYENFDLDFLGRPY